MENRHIYNSPFIWRAFVSTSQDVIICYQKMFSATYRNIMTVQLVWSNRTLINSRIKRRRDIKAGLEKWERNDGRFDKEWNIWFTVFVNSNELCSPLPRQSSRKLSLSKVASWRFEMPFWLVPCVERESTLGKHLDIALKGNKTQITSQLFCWLHVVC